MKKIVNLRAYFRCEDLNTLFNYDWVEGNRLRVAESSGGKLRYLYLPDTAAAGYNAFNRDFFAQLDNRA